MGLSILNPLPDPMAKVRELTEENTRLRDQIDDLEGQLRKERRKSVATETGAAELKKILEPLYQGLGMIFGQIESMGVTGSANATSPATNAVWESWKQKLGGKAAEAVDVLMLHGEMNAEQLRIHLKCGRNYVYNVISALHKASLINKNGGRISLKEL